MSTGPVSPDTKRTLDRLHTLLMRLHKDLLERERAAYEREVAPVANPMELFRLAQSHESFAWLRPILQLIVTIDETADARGGATEESSQECLSIAREMFDPDRGDESFLDKLDDACADSPAVANLQTELRQALGENR